MILLYVGVEQEDTNMPDQQTQQKEKELPTAGPAMMSYLRELAPFLAREGSTTTIGPDNSIKHSYKMPMEAKQALVGAREQTGLPSYKGLDPQDIIALMGQRQQLDKQAMEDPAMMSRQLYQERLGQQAMQQGPNQNMRSVLNNLAGMAQQEQRGQSAMDVRQTPQARTKAQEAASTGAAKQSSAMGSWLSSGGKDIASKIKQKEYNQERIDIAATTKLDLIGGVVPKGTTNKPEYFNSSTKEYNNSLVQPTDTSLLIYGDNIGPATATDWNGTPGTIEADLGISVAELDKYIPKGIDRDSFIRATRKRSKELNVPVAAVIEQWIRSLANNPVR